MDPMTDIRNLRRLRQEAGLTQAELSIEVGVSQAYIARVETGSLDPKLSIVNKIIEVLNRKRSTTGSELMTPTPVTVDARDTVSVAVSLMQEKSYSQLPVLRGTQVVGIVTEWDIIKNLQHDLHEISVQSIMSDGSTLMVDETTAVDVILPLFENYQDVLVLNQGRLQGIITRSDLLKLI